MPPITSQPSGSSGPSAATGSSSSSSSAFLPRYRPDPTNTRVLLQSLEELRDSLSNRVEQLSVAVERLRGQAGELERAAALGTALSPSFTTTSALSNITPLPRPVFARMSTPRNEQASASSSSLPSSHAGQGSRSGGHGYATRLAYIPTQHAEPVRSRGHPPTNLAAIAKQPKPIVVRSPRPTQDSSSPDPIAYTPLPAEPPAEPSEYETTLASLANLTTGRYRAPSRPAESSEPPSSRPSVSSTPSERTRSEASSSRRSDYYGAYQSSGLTSRGIMVRERQGHPVDREARNIVQVAQDLRAGVMASPPSVTAPSFTRDLGTSRRHRYVRTLESQIEQAEARLNETRAAWMRSARASADNGGEKALKELYQCYGVAFRRDLNDTSGVSTPKEAANFAHSREILRAQIGAAHLEVVDSVARQRSGTLSGRAGWPVELEVHASLAPADVRALYDDFFTWAQARRRHAARQAETTEQMQRVFDQQQTSRLRLPPHIHNEIVQRQQEITQPRRSRLRPSSRADDEDTETQGPDQLTRRRLRHLRELQREHRPSLFSSREANEEATRQQQAAAISALRRAQVLQALRNESGTWDLAPSERDRVERNLTERDPELHATSSTISIIEQSRARTHALTRELELGQQGNERPVMRRVLANLEQMLASGRHSEDIRRRLEALVAREREVLAEIDARLPDTSGVVTRLGEADSRQLDIGRSYRRLASRQAELSAWGDWAPAPRSTAATQGSARRLSDVTVVPPEGPEATSDSSQERDDSSLPSSPSPSSPASEIDPDGAFRALPSLPSVPLLPPAPALTPRSPPSSGNATRTPSFPNTPEGGQAEPAEDVFVVTIPLIANEEEKDEPAPHAELAAQHWPNAPARRRVRPYVSILDL
ncbi:hypothetical protein A1Q2_07193 [Trichosporon asahii var. asahii CBS 8904]|uniref:Uncharacterized protein n=1 Tax=Trichosporon asahii var. asahii (strain CBS 8904) TaxID=1220162 RepID=K1VHB4_TRIAC|nr:hypothetical protein A1Q2_07193 [Trichosporon asahii var. asahii CBS 8904]